jgi:hypothetical protein
MRTRVTTIPKLLTDPVRPSSWEIKINLGREEWVLMIFSEERRARNQYNQLRSSGIYAESWITEIELREIYPSHA